MNDSVSSSFAHLHLLKHPFYKAWMAGSLTHEILSIYAMQYYFHVNRFPRYLSSIHSFCEDSLQRQEIMMNLDDEEGSQTGISHPELWLRFAEGLGVTREEVESSLPCQTIQNVTSTFFRLSRSSFHEGLGALYAYESQIPEIAESKLEGLRKHYGVTDERTLAFFEVHRIADVHHRAAILKIIETFPENEKTEAKEAAQHAAQSLWNFLTEMCAGCA